MISRRSGFTIVELLIVVVVIAILATITVVAYNGITNQAYDSSVRSDLTSTAKKITLYRLEKDTWPTGNDLNLVDIKVNRDAFSRGLFNGTSWFNLVYCWPNAGTDPERFALIAQSKSGKVFTWVNGTIGEIPEASFTGSVTACTAAGSTLANSSARDWFYDSDSWRFFVK